MARAGRPKGINGCTHLIQNFLGIGGSEPLDSALLEREQSHQVLPYLPKGFGVILAANTFIILQNSLSKAGLAQFDIASNSEPGYLVRDSINLPAPVHVFELGHRD